jgi:hypothetical protein
MNDWAKIQTFDRIHQAELRKEILQQNGIEAVIINERDSLFLIGDIELYVKEEDRAKAKIIIGEFEGLTKINSFILEKPIMRLHEFLTKQGIETVVKRKDDSQFILENFELFIANEKVTEVVPYLTGEKLTGWSKVDTCTRTRQTRFKVELLEERDIETIIIKKRDSEYHVEEINIYVPNEKLLKAKEIILNLNGWIKIEAYDMLHRAEIREDLLGKNKIRAIIRKEKDNEFTLLVEAHNEEQAIDVINKQREWTKIKAFPLQVNALYAQENLEKEGVEAILIDRKDNAFLLGDIDLYVDDFKTQKALEILNNLENLENLEE